jgi:AAA+ ATPase superfamily predicted ATPase
MKPQNPFIVSGYYSPEFFCNRKNEAARIINALENGRNITLFSIRRLGKTGLIDHVFYHLKTNKKFHLFYLDILPTTDLSGFINLFAATVLGKLESAPEKFIKKIGDLFAGIRPAISFDPYTGMPTLQINIQSTEDADKSLQKIFAYLKQTGKNIVIAIDEFQQIVSYPEKNVEAVLRTNIQRAAGINFIFSGSQTHILLSIFSQYGKPFYQSTEMVQLERIEKSEYSKFIISKFERGKKKISDSAAELILDICRVHTYYVQFLCNRLYGLKNNLITEPLVRETLKSILKENEAVYINYRNLLTDYQWKVLTAIAYEGNAKLITSKDFISKHHLGTPSSVHTAVKSLLEKEMVYKEQDDYFIYDVFLERWLESF